MNKSVIAHAIRGYLARTETFVGNQVTTLQEHESVVIAHHRGPNREFDVKNLYIINEQKSGARKKLGDIAYTSLRAMLPADVTSASEWLRRFSPVLWHFHFAVDAAFFLPLYRAMSIPAIVSLYGYDVSSFPHRMKGIGRLYLKRAFEQMDCFLAMSEDMKRDVVAIGAPEEKVLVHYHGVNAERFRFDRRAYCQEDTCTILCVGSLEGKKGQHHLIRSIAELRRERPDIDVRVVFVGEGPLREELVRLVRESDLENRVEMAGYVPHLAPRFLQYYRDADVFVHFSTTQSNNDKEGIPGTIVEAMASGLPVITTRHAGIPDVIANGVHGILLEERDVQGIARTVLQLCENPQLRANLGQSAARRALTELDLETKTRQLEQIYRNVVKNHKRERPTQ